MKKSILSIGKTLSRAEQKMIGGGGPNGSGVGCSPGTCPSGEVCDTSLPHLSMEPGTCITQGDDGYQPKGNGHGRICPENVGQNCNSSY